ncbi:nitroreductase/quinone reductase family protein [Nocardia sp. NPDC127579]|uniref:nitroreductase/quinone reductase family protein n=1 Tax=Nocardia sp. NPDC127579 TaxID=3345402 RepID=UPI00362A3A7E
MWIWIAFLLGTPVGLALAGFLFLLLSMRTGYRPGLTAVRRFNRRFTNRQNMKTAGRVGANASVIRHVGRVSGKPYETPIGIAEADGDFLTLLPYGTSADWLRNVLAAGSAEVVHEGVTYRVDGPEVVAWHAVAQHLSAGERLAGRIFGVEHVLRLPGPIAQ